MMAIRRRRRPLRRDRAARWSNVLRGAAVAVLAAITGALASYENALQAARSLWLASDSVNRAEFSSFALARTDALTGVANRWAWDDELPLELARSARSGQPLVARADRALYAAKEGGRDRSCAAPAAGAAPAAAWTPNR
jgi:GGDEF domain-containing protein